MSVPSATMMIFCVEDDSGVCFLLGNRCFRLFQVLFFNNTITCESEASVITCDIHSFSTQFFSNVGLLPLADDEADQFRLTSIAGQKTSPLLDLVTRNNVSETSAPMVEL